MLNIGFIVSVIVAIFALIAIGFNQRHNFAQVSDSSQQKLAGVFAVAMVVAVFFFLNR